MAIPVAQTQATTTTGLGVIAASGAAATLVGALFMPWVAGELANGAAFTLSASRVKDDLAKDSGIGGFIGSHGIWVLGFVALAAAIMILDLVVDDPRSVSLDEKEYGFVLLALGL